MNRNTRRTARSRADVAAALAAAPCSARRRSLALLRRRPAGASRQRGRDRRRRAAEGGHAHLLGLGAAGQGTSSRPSRRSTRRSRSTWSTRAPAPPSTPSCRTRSRPAPASPTSRRSSTTRCRSSRSASRSPTSSSYGLDSLKSDYTAGRVGRGERQRRAWSACRRTPARWRCSTTRRSSTSTASTVPTTWDEYVADAKKLHAANPKEYITSDTGDPGFATSMIWQAGGKPFQRQRHHERHHQPAGRGHAEVRQPSGTSWSRRPARRRSPAGATSGTRPGQRHHRHAW